MNQDYPTAQDHHPEAGNHEVKGEPGTVTKDGYGLATIILSDGRVAKYFRKPKARDIALAGDNAKTRDNDMRRVADIVARLITIDDQKVNPDQLLELEMEDWALIGNNIPINFTLLQMS